MRRVLMFVAVVAVLALMTAGAVNAVATRAEVTATFEMTATWPGDIQITKSGILRQVGAEASGPTTSSDPRLTGTLQIVLNAVFNLNTGKGNAFGSFMFLNAEGTFEGRYTVKDTDYVYFEGRLEGHGTGAYEGLLLKLEMTGLDWYRDADPETNGISAVSTGYILSPHGA